VRGFQLRRSGIGTRIQRVWVEIDVPINLGADVRIARLKRFVMEPRMTGLAEKREFAAI
jgi:hypothetical protein